MAEPSKEIPPSETAAASASDDAQSEDGWQPGEKYNWFRGVFFQATIVGIAAFAAPGLWNAMNSVGAGGQQTPYLVMAGNALLFSLMTITCLIGSIVANRFGLKYTLIFGTTGFVLYSAALYTNNRYGTEWFIYVGSAACGITAGLFWSAEGAIMLSYPEADKRGKYLAYWLCYRNSGSILGGAINLAFNAKGSRTGKLDWRTYIVFVVLQCLGPALAFLLSPPEKVRRRNGTRVAKIERISDLEELKALGRLMIRKELLLLTPLFIYINWCLPYIGSYMSLYFTVRSRALASLVSALAQIVGTLFMGTFLDWPRFSVRTRATSAYIFVMALIGGCWAWGTVVQREYSARSPGLDWSDDGFGRGWALYILWQTCWALTYNFGYWMIGSLAREAADVPRLTSYVRALESAGQTISSGISSTKTPLITALGINFGLWGVAIVPAYLVVSKIGVDYVGFKKSETTARVEEAVDTKA
ncbi:major facilitator superfamily domain-containing protein [Plectosphaerella cucumerina]|uniref:Major facilitator superfamily domain-containing protein n=1 Tax=Plectosphaerella cucumerina TaxID=40658 RepID=A0A8K0TSL2_9PEZI|nr:major facilitator superfamily domain-containing protein [Plectosphaerella cucumerina]